MMKKLLTVLTSFALAASLLAGCSSGGNNSSSQAGTSPSGSTQLNSVQTGSAKSLVRIGALQGPTGLGLVELMEKNENKEADNFYEFTLAGAPDEISGKIISGELDIACVPTNMAAVLHAKTEGKVQIIGVNTLGVLYLLQKTAFDESSAEESAESGETASAEDGETESGSESDAESEESADESDSSDEAEASSEAEAETEEITSFADLSGKTIYSTGQGATQEYVLGYLLAQNGVTDAQVVFKSEHAELASLMVAGEAEYALLPQPFVTTVMGKDDSVRKALDITAQWEQATGSQLTMGCVVVRSDFLEKNEAAVDSFLAELAESVNFVNQNVDDAAALAGKFEVIAEEVAAKAIPDCNIVALTGQEMKTSVAAYLDVLYTADPKSVGGALPDDSFYYLG